MRKNLGALIQEGGGGGVGRFPNFKTSLLIENTIDVIQILHSLRACSHEPGTVNYPGVMIAPGQALPRVHMIICCPGSTSLPRGKFIVF